MQEHRLILDHVYDHEAAYRDQLFLTQPLGSGQVAEYTWGQVLDSSRRMAAHLRSLGMPPGSRIAMLSNNSAHCFMVDLAV
jgi:long-chain acyl-CoA synthetase